MDSQLEFVSSDLLVSLFVQKKFPMSDDVTPLLYVFSHPIRHLWCKEYLE